MHISDDTGRIAMYEYRTVGWDNSPQELMRYIYSNNLSSAMLELDDNGEIISYEEYHPFGTTAYQATNSQINAVAKRYRYTGKERDEESGLYYHGARYYIPWLCRWTQCDPIGIKDGLNIYAYCSNNPTRLNDPSGQGGNDPQEGSYTVKKGDTLTKLAKENNTTVEELKKLNKIENINDIKVGQKLNPGTSATKTTPTPQQANLKGLKLYIAKPNVAIQSDYLAAVQAKADMLKKMSIPPPTESTGEKSARVNKDNAVEIVQDGKVINTIKPNEFGLVQLTKLGNNNIVNNAGSEDSYKYLKKDGTRSEKGQHGDDWMKPKYAAAFFNAVNDLAKEMPEQQISFNDASGYNPVDNKPSYNLGHSTTGGHSSGESFDIKFLTTDGKGSNVISSLTKADIKLNARFIEILKSHGFTTFYSDNGKVPGSVHAGGHDNHLHGGMK